MTKSTTMVNLYRLDLPFACNFKPLLNNNNNKIPIYYLKMTEISALKMVGDTTTNKTEENVGVINQYHMWT
jgi:hypothetical protein